MRKANRAKAQTVLTKEDIKKALKDTATNNFDNMINNGLYSFRIKKYFYEAGKLSKKGFLFNSDIYVLPLGKKNAKGKILIDDGVLAIFDRFLLARDFTMKGDAMTAFLIDVSDKLYEVIKTNAGKQEKLPEAEYVHIFNSAYLDVEESLTENEIGLYLNDKPDLLDLIALHNLELSNNNEK